MKEDVIPRLQFMPRFFLRFVERSRNFLVGSTFLNCVSKTDFSIVGGLVSIFLYFYDNAPSGQDGLFS